MPERFDRIIRHGIVATASGCRRADIGIVGEQIAALGDLKDVDAPDEIDASGLHVLPGVIDLQVHFRDPGHPHKEDMTTGSRAAILGGVTCVMDSANTDPPTTTLQRLRDKIAGAAGRLYCDATFAFAATADNSDSLAAAEEMPECCAVEIFMATTTGGVKTDTDELIERTLRSASRRVIVHAADEGRVMDRRRIAEDAKDVSVHPRWRDAESSRLGLERLLRIARRVGRQVHVTGVSSEEELILLAQNRDLATSDVTVNHLVLEAEDAYARLGLLAHMNPPIRERAHREALWRAISSGLIDGIGTDHAPHTLAEKMVPYPAGAAGIPGVQTALPLMLDQVNQGHLTLERLASIIAEAPARILGLSRKGRIAPGLDADLVLVDLSLQQAITRSWLASKCGWSPFEGQSVKGWPVMTLLRGSVVAAHGEVKGEPQGSVASR